MHFKKFPGIILLLILLTVGCRKHTSAPEPQPREEEIHYDFSYGNDPQQTMDVYIPYGIRDTMALIVMVHGGSWISRDKSDFSPWFERMKTFKRYALVNINYRLDTTAAPPVPMQTDDIALAIEKTRETFGLKAGRIGLMGMSSGGHITSLYAYRYDTDHDVKALVNFVGPVDFNDPQYHTPGHWSWIFSGIEYIFGVPYDGHESYYASVSPYAWVDTQSPATILFYAGQDTLVPYTQGERLHARLDSFSVTNEYYFYPNSGHTFNTSDAIDATLKAESFLRRHL